WLNLAGLPRIGGDGDVLADADGLQLALEGAVLLGGDISDGRHDAFSLSVDRDPFPVDGPTETDGARRTRTRRAAASAKDRSRARLLLPARSRIDAAGKNLVKRWFRGLRPAVGHGLKRRK